MAEDPKGFAADLGELDQIANVALPQVANVLRAPIPVITAQEGVAGPVRFAGLDGMEGEYTVYANDIAYRQRVGCERIDATITALHEIIALYRRVDGQR